MSRKDFIVIADIAVEQINTGMVKKKDRDAFLNTMTIRMSNWFRTFDAVKFREYIEERI